MGVQKNSKNRLFIVKKRILFTILWNSLCLYKMETNKKKRGQIVKVGIVTITNGENYGNRLQNYAVQEALKDVGFQPETIHKITNVFDAENSKYLWKLRVKRFLHYHLTQEERRRLNFYRFTHTYITKSKFVIDQTVPMELDKEYSYFIAGSDQVWNPFLEYCTAENFLTFTKRQKKIAFSPSIAVNQIPKEREEEFLNWISDFRLLSVREKQGAELIWNLCGRRAEVLADPTLYISAKQWRKMEKKVKVKQNGYILAYFLGSCADEYRKYIEKLASTHNLIVFWLQTPEHFAIAPDEFLYLVDHAACICTDSFHGTIFSVLFHRPFLVFKRKENFADMSSRIDDLLALFQMEGRTINTIKENQIFKLNFKKTDSIIIQERERMKKFLLKIREGESNA